MDRQILYPAEIPLVEDGLNAQRNAMVGVGHLASAAFGANTVAASGFACSPADGLAVTIAPGALLAPGVVDASAYGTLTAVSSALVRQFISRDPVSLTVPSAGAAYVVYVTPQTVDTDDTVLPFYNAADPSVTYAGQNNSGLAAPTVRRDEAVLAVGSSAPSGAYPLWQIVVPAGATTLTADMLSIASGAPFYPSLAAVASRIIAPFNAQLAVAIGGYPLNAVVAGTSPGTFWVSTADANVSVPGATDATWQSLFNGYATEAWAEGLFVTSLGDSLTLRVNSVGINTQTNIPWLRTASGFTNLQLAGDYATNTALAAETTRATTIESNLQSSKQDKLGFTPVQQGGGVNQGSSTVKIGWGSGEYSGHLAATVDATDIGMFAMTSDLPTDGTFEAASITSYIEFLGGSWRKTGNILEQWLTYQITQQVDGSGDMLYTYPIALADAPLFISASSGTHSSGSNYSVIANIDYGRTHPAPTATQFGTHIVDAGTGGFFNTPLCTFTVYVKGNV